jgi:hypothetical protein
LGLDQRMGQAEDNKRVATPTLASMSSSRSATMSRKSDRQDRRLVERHPGRTSVGQPTQPPGPVNAPAYRARDTCKIVRAFTSLHLKAPIAPLGPPGRVELACPQFRGFEAFQAPVLAVVRCGTGRLCAGPFRRSTFHPPLKGWTGTERRGCLASFGFRMCGLPGHFGL